MTLEQLEKLSDEELNRKAHELIGKCWHVWEWIPYGFIKIGSCKFCKSKYQEEFARTQPNYCQDFNDAFKLVEWAKTKGWFATVVSSNNHCYFFTKDSDNKILEMTEAVFADSIPKAITVAFILAFDKE